MKNIKIEIKWALAFFIMSLLWMGLEKIAGFHSTYIDKQPYAALLFIIPATSIYTAALVEKKKKTFQGHIAFKQAFLSGLLLTLFIAVLSPLSQAIISTYITPDYFKNVIAYSVQVGHFSSAGRAEDYYNLENFLVQSVVGAMSMGVVISIITAFFIRTKHSK